MGYEYISQVQSAIRRINRRLSDVADKLGKDSEYFQSMQRQLDDNIPEENLRWNKSNVLQISKPSDFFGDKSKEKIIEQLDKNVPTWGSIRKENEEQYNIYKFEAEVRGEKIVEINEYIQIRDNIQNAIEYLYDGEIGEDGKIALEIMQSEGRKTYADLRKVLDYVNEERESHKRE